MQVDHALLSVINKRLGEPHCFNNNLRYKLRFVIFVSVIDGPHGREAVLLEIDALDGDADVDVAHGGRIRCI